MKKLTFTCPVCVAAVPTEMTEPLPEHADIRVVCAQGHQLMLNTGCKKHRVSLTPISEAPSPDHMLCGECGTWFDRSHLDQVFEHMHTGRPVPAAMRGIRGRRVDGAKGIEPSFPDPKSGDLPN